MKNEILKQLTNFEIENEINFFRVNGNRDSIAIFSGFSVTPRVWLGKNNDDSGGLTITIREDNLSQTLNLVKRFLGSGRRKILRNYELNKRN